MPVLDGTDEAALASAAMTLAAGGLVALPTETVYGLGARAEDDAAVAAIFAAKGRPADHPLIVHVADAEAAQHFAAEWPQRAARLAQAFWPGPVTLIVPRRADRATAAAGGQESIGLRCPSHPVAQALLRQALALGVMGVAAPSANRFGRVSPTRAAHVAEEFGPPLLVLDGGDCQEGIESAIVDCRGEKPSLLRPGTVGREALEAALGEALVAPGRDAPRASGTLESHYAPQARVLLLESGELHQALQAAQSAAGLIAAAAETGTVALYARSAELLALAVQRGWVNASMPDSPAAAAHQLFADLRRLDTTGCRQIWIERPPEDSAWEGVRDRLQRAAA